LKSKSEEGLLRCMQEYKEFAIETAALIRTLIAARSQFDDGIQIKLMNRMKNHLVILKTHLTKEDVEQLEKRTNEYHERCHLTQIKLENRQK
jgi:hypothetical protein